MVEDKEIIRLYFDRSESAISVTAEKYGAFCHRIAKNILGCDEDAEECVSDAYLALWNQIPPQVPASLRAFIGKIVRNISLDRLDYNTAPCRFANTVEILDEISEILPDESSQIPQGDTLAAALDRFLAGEKKRYREIFVRRYWFCDSVKEIAQRFGLGESGVKSILFRVRKRLSAYLKKEAYDIE